MGTDVAEHPDHIAIADGEQRPAEQGQRDSITGADQLVDPTQRQPTGRKHMLSLALVTFGVGVISRGELRVQIVHSATVTVTRRPENGHSMRLSAQSH